MRLLLVLSLLCFLPTYSHMTFAKSKSSKATVAKTKKINRSKKSKQTKKVAQKNRMPILKLKQLAQLELHQRIKYIKLLRTQIVELNQLQNDFNSTMKKKSAALELLNQNRMWALLLGQKLYAADGAYQRGSASENCIMAFGLYKNAGGAGSCPATTCDVTYAGATTGRGVKCNFVGSGLSGANACVAMKNYEEGTWACQERMALLNRDNRSKINERLTNYKAFMRKHVKNGTVDLNSLFSNPEALQKELDKLMTYAYNDEVYAHLVKLVEMYRQAKVSFPKHLLTKHGALLGDQFDAFERDFNQMVGGIQNVWGDYINHCGKPLTDKDVGDVRSGKYKPQISSQRFQRLENFRQGILKCLDKGEYPDIAMSVSPAGGDLDELKRERKAIYRRQIRGCKSASSTSADEKDFYATHRVETIMNNPECSAMMIRYDNVKQKLSQLNYDVPGTGDPYNPQDPPPRDELGEGERILETVSLGCSGYTDQNSMMLTSSFQCLACAAERRKINRDEIKIEEARGIASIKYELNENYAVSTRWLSFLESMAYICGENGSLPRDVGMEEAQNFIELYGHCDMEKYDWDNYSDAQSKMEKIRALRNAKTRKTKSYDKGDLFEETYGISAKDAKKKFCQDGDETKEKRRSRFRKYADNLSTKYQNSKLSHQFNACAQESAANAEKLYPILSGNKMLCDVSFDRKPNMNDARAKIGHVITDGSECYVAKQFNRVRMKHGVVKLETVYTTQHRSDSIRGLEITGMPEAGKILIYCYDASGGGKFVDPNGKGCDQKAYKYSSRIKGLNVSSNTGICKEQFYTSFKDRDWSPAKRSRGAK